MTEQYQVTIQSQMGPREGVLTLSYQGSYVTGSLDLVGYPIWNGQAPKIISTFLETYDFDGKTIVPFCTSGSSSIGSSADALEDLTQGTTWLEGQRFSGSASQETVSQWVDALDLDLGQTA